MPNYQVMSKPDYIYYPQRFPMCKVPQPKDPYFVANV